MINETTTVKETKHAVWTVVTKGAATYLVYTTRTCSTETVWSVPDNNASPLRIEGPHKDIPAEVMKALAG